MAEVRARDVDELERVAAVQNLSGFLHLQELDRKYIRRIL